MSNTLSWLQLFNKLTPILELGAKHIEENKLSVIRALQQYKAKPVDYDKFCFFEQDSYSKNLVKSFGSNCNVIIMCWSAGQESAIHGHEGSKCFVKVLSGELLEQRFLHPEVDNNGHSTCKQSEMILNENDVCYIDDSVGVHKVTNKSSSKSAITLHIYIPAYTRCRLFDTSMKLGKSVDVTFTSQFGAQHQTSKCESGSV